MVFVPPLILIYSALNYYIYHRPLIGYVAKFVLRNPAHETGGGKWRDPVSVEIPQGKLKGSQEFSRSGRTFYWFRGIPYAKPPVDDLRYEPPQPHEGWQGERDATKYGSECLQINFITRKVTGSENCLFLNVATRKLPNMTNEYPRRRRFRPRFRPRPRQSKDALYPVIFFIHGGLFMFGQAHTFGPKYFMDEEVVLVSINYRLNSFGFLNTGDGVVQGNQGMKDQVLALQWVQQNIRYFNGDPDRVTLIGESAGASCVHLHTISPMSRGLFSGAISLSGTALAPWAQVYDPSEQARAFGDGVGCPSKDGSEAMIKCIKAKDANEVTRYHMGALINAAQGKQTIFAPTVDSGSDNLFMPEPPVEMLRNGNVSDRPWITGVNSGDGLVYLIAVLRNESMRQYVNQEWQRLAPQVLSYRDHENKSQVTMDIVEYYLNNQEISQETILESNDMLSDRGFFLDSHDAAVMQSEVAPTYVYYYTYEGVFNGGNMLFTKANLPLPSDANYVFGGGMVWLRSVLTNKPEKSKFGICHGDEMPLLFNVPFIRKEVDPSDTDYEFSRKLVGLWVSFAEDGVPDTTRAGVQWDPVKPPSKLQKPFVEGVRAGDISLKRLNIDRDLTIIDEPFHDRLGFWKNHSITYLPDESRKNSVKLACGK